MGSKQHASKQTTGKALKHEIMFFLNMAFAQVFCKQADARSRKQMVAAESVFVRINKKERIERPDWKQAAEAICRNSWMRGRQKQHLRANKYFELQTFLGDNHSNSNCFGLQTVKLKVIWVANIQAQAILGCRRSNSIHFGLQTFNVKLF